MSVKEKLREQTIEEISSLTREYILRSDAAICSKLLNSSRFARAKRVFAYFAIGREVATAGIISESLRLGKSVALPVALGGGVMFFAEIKEGAELVSGVLGIPQPAASSKPVIAQSGDIMLIPALCYDRSGYRLGRGAGYYDRYLPSCSAYKIGLARRALIIDSLPTGEKDVPVDEVITD